MENNGANGNGSEGSLFDLKRILATAKAKKVLVSEEPEQVDADVESLSSEVHRIEVEDLADKMLGQSKPTINLAEVMGQVTSNSLAPAFFDSVGRIPAHTLQTEKAHHRVMIYAAATGATPPEIAAEFGFNVVTVRYVLAQPWAKSLLAEIIARKGGDAVVESLTGAAGKAADLLIATIDDDKCDIRVRSQNAKEILDRVYGRAQQVINHRSIDAKDLSDDELANLAKTARTGTQ